MGYVIPPPPVPALPVAGSSDLFPVRRIYCIGRNYAEHAREMGHDPDREPPFFFQKSADTLLPAGTPFPYPPRSQAVHHEIELVACLGKGGKDIPAAAALDHVWGYAVGLDMTRRDLQDQMKHQRRPWEIAKAFEHAAPCGPVHPAAAIGHPSAGAIRLTVNGDIRQEGDLDQMIWSIPDSIACLSTLFTLAPGDLLMTGTPAGVGPVRRGDVMRGHIDGAGDLEVKVI